MKNFRFWSIGSAALFLPAVALSMVTASGCSDSNDGDGGTNDSGTTPDAKVDAATDTDSGTSAASVCTQAEFDANDHTGTNGADVSQNLKDGAFVYVNNCVKIKVGQKVNFSMAFDSHPLVPVATAPNNPIVETRTGTDVSFTFSQAGTFGYKCAFHATMQGDVQVVP